MVIVVVVLFVLVPVKVAVIFVWCDVIGCFVRTFGLEFPDAHIRRSAKSLTSLARASGQQALPTTVQFSSEEEFSLSTVALVLLCASWAAISSRCSSDATRSVAFNAKGLLHVLVDKALGDSDIEWTLSMSSGSVAVAVNRGTVDLSATLGQTCLARSRLTTGPTSIGDALISMVAIMKTSKHSESVALARSLCHQFCGLLFLMVETQVELKDHNSASLPVLRLSGGRRPRRISTAVKLDIVEAAGQSSNIQTPAELVAASEVLSKRAGLSEPVKAKSANRFIRSSLYQYTMSARSMWSSVRHVSLATDAGRVSGDDLQLQVYYSQEADIGNWAPPQAFSHGWEMQFSNGLKMQFRRNHVRKSRHV